MNATIPASLGPLGFDFKAHITHPNAHVHTSAVLLLVFIGLVIRLMTNPGKEHFIECSRCLIQPYYADRTTTVREDHFYC